MNKDLEFKLEDFETGKSNILLVTGFPGSGKTTLAEELAEKYDALHFQLDWFTDFMFGETTVEELEEMDEIGLIEYIESNNIEGGQDYDNFEEEEIVSMIRNYIKFIIEWCKKQNDKFIIEGLSLYDVFREGDDFITSCPIIIKGEDAETSIRRAARRNTEVNPETDEEDWYNELIKFADADTKKLDALTKELSLAEDFKLYESMWEETSPLKEAKADTEKLIAFAGEDLANRFLAIKNKLKAPENDLYYWIKKGSVGELEQTIIKVEDSKSKTKIKKDIADEGAKLVANTPHWKIYHITTFEAAQKYGRDTKWCITGVDGYGDKYWNEYTAQGINFYFLITKGDYDPRGTECKFAIAHYPDDFLELSNLATNYEIYNQIDEYVGGLDLIPYHEEINIPGVDLHRITVITCLQCRKTLEPEEVMKVGDFSYCKTCFDKHYVTCDLCGKVILRNFCFENSEKFYCDTCEKDAPFNPHIVKGCHYTIKHKADHPHIWLSGNADTPEQLNSKIVFHCKNNPRLNLTIVVFSNVTGEVLINLEGTASSLVSEVTAQINTINPEFWQEYEI